MVGAGERAFFMAEQFRLHQFGRDRRTVYGDQRLPGAAAGPVQGVDEHFFAYACFALHQHRDVLLQ
ncbi:hypothetical protein D3C71_1932840 [compost metagenome]